MVTVKYLLKHPSVQVGTALLVEVICVAIVVITPLVVVSKATSSSPISIIAHANLNQSEFIK